MELEALLDDPDELLPELDDPLLLEPEEPLDPELDKLPLEELLLELDELELDELLLELELLLLELDEPEESLLEEFPLELEEGGSKATAALKCLAFDFCPPATVETSCAFIPLVCFMSSPQYENHQRIGIVKQLPISHVAVESQTF